MVRIRSLVLPALLALAGFVFLVSLGNWQMARLAWKQQLIENATQRPQGPVRDLPAPGEWGALDIADEEYRPFRLTGRFLHQKESRIFTSVSDQHGRYGGPGFWIVTPFALSGGGTVLINRGFAPQGQELPAARGEELRALPTSVVGLLRPNEPRTLFTPSDRPKDGIFFARNVDAIAAAQALPGAVAPFTIDLVASETPAGGLPQAGETRVLFSNNHLQYAITWYGLAAALLAVFASFLWSGWREGHRSAA